MRGCVERIPSLRNAELVKQVNGLESFTPDGEFILGESPEVTGFWVACGFCAHGVSGSGGVGKVMAEWIVEGEPSLDLWHMDLRRFGANTASRRYIATRVDEVYSTYYDISYPAGRSAPASCASARSITAWKVWARSSAKRPAGNDPTGSPPTSAWPKVRTGRRLWLGQPPLAVWRSAPNIRPPASAWRCSTTRRSARSKFRARARWRFLQRITDNQMDQPIGTITYTQMLNARGGIECDLTVTRLAADRFQIITGTAFGPHDLAWIRRHMPGDGSVYVDDITSSRCCIGLWGPHAREILQQVSATISRTPPPHI